MPIDSHLRHTVRCVVVATLALAVLLAGAVPAAAEDADPAAEAVVLNVGWTTDPQNLNPFIGFETATQELITLQYDYLTDFDPDTLQPRPRLAESWEMSEDGLEWTFKIRDGVLWQDGEPCTADDVAFTFNYVIDNDLALMTTYTPYIETVEAIDDTTVRFTLEKPKANMLALMIPIVPRHIWENVSGEEAVTTFQNDPPIIGTGPFQIVEYKPNVYTKLVANKEYWGGAPKIDELIFSVYKDPVTMGSDLQTGTLDCAVELPVAVFQKFVGKEGYGTSKANPFRASHDLGFNCYDGEASKGHPILLDPEFRRALNYAIDKERIKQVAYNGDCEIAQTIIVKDYYTDPDWHWEPAEGVAYTYDLEKAGQMLDAAGYADGDGDGVREYEGEPIKLRLWTYSAVASHPTTGKILTQSFRDLGLDIEFQVMDEGAMIDKMWAYDGDTFAPDYDMFIWGWSGDVDPNFVLSVFTKGQIEAWSDSNWSSDEYDRLYELQGTEIDPEARKDYIWQLQELVYKESPTAFFAYPAFYSAWNTADWEGWIRTPSQDGHVALTQYFDDSYRNVQPRVATATTDSGGLSTGAIVGIIVACVVVVGGAVLFVVLRRRGRHIEEV